MAKVAAVSMMLVTLGCVLSQYYPGYHNPYQQTMVRPHYAPFLPPAPYMPHPLPMATHHMGAYMRPPMPFTPRVPPPPPPPPVFAFAPQNHIYSRVPYAPAASFQHNTYTRHVQPAIAMYQTAHHPPKPRFPFRGGYQHDNAGAYSHQAPKGFFSKIKPFLFGQTEQKSHPHHPYYPNYFHPHVFTPNRPFHNKPHHHSYHYQHHHQGHHGQHHQQSAGIGQYMQQEHSCSCSLHVGDIIVYKHTDMRASYSCSDLTDCKSFCTNLFSSEDLRAQTRADACLLMGQDGSWPWFRRDQVCGDFGLKNDTKLSVDLCCKDLQAC